MNERIEFRNSMVLKWKGDAALRYVLLFRVHDDKNIIKEVIFLPQATICIYS